MGAHSWRPGGQSQQADRTGGRRCLRVVVAGGLLAWGLWCLAGMALGGSGSAQANDARSRELRRMRDFIRERNERHVAWREHHERRTAARAGTRSSQVGSRLESLAPRAPPPPPPQPPSVPLEGPSTGEPLSHAPNGLHPACRAHQQGQVGRGRARSLPLTVCGRACVQLRGGPGRFTSRDSCREATVQRNDGRETSAIGVGAVAACMLGRAGGAEWVRGR